MVFRHTLLCVLLALPAAAQPPKFASVNIRPARSTDARNSRVAMQPSGDLVASAVPVATLLSNAYELPVNGSPRLSPPLPGWAIRDRYDIEVKAPANGMPIPSQDEEVQNRMRQMIRQVLADDFGLVLRVENKMMPVYELTLGSGGPKLQTSALTSKDCAFDTGPQPCHSFADGLGHPLNARAITMDDLARYISNWTDLPVVNRTALAGLFTVNTEGWMPMRLPPPPPGADPGANPFAGLPTIFTVLSKLGLELKRQEDTLPVYTVEHIERPNLN